eukprot:359773-Chlamydomonas_euryale.AAC.4
MHKSVHAMRNGACAGVSLWPRMWAAAETGRFSEITRSRFTANILPRALSGADALQGNIGRGASMFLVEVLSKAKSGMVLGLLVITHRGLSFLLAIRACLAEFHMSGQGTCSRNCDCDTISTPFKPTLSPEDDTSLPQN